MAVSGMLYRMKQNAAGLASICILSTMVLVVISTTVSMYVGIQDELMARYPNDVLHWSDMVMKILSNILVIVLNFVFSKLFIFAKKTEKA